MENSTVYAPQSGGRAEVKINPKDSVELPVGEYLFKTLYGDKMCGYFVNVKGEGLIMTYIIYTIQGSLLLLTIGQPMTHHN